MYSRVSCVCLSMCVCKYISLNTSPSSKNLTRPTIEVHVAVRVTVTLDEVCLVKNGRGKEENGEGVHPYEGGRGKRQRIRA
jgi:hypothetical protein